VKQETIKILENTGSNLFDINRSNFLLDTSPEVRRGEVRRGKGNKSKNELLGLQDKNPEIY